MPIDENQLSTHVWCGHLIHFDNDLCLKKFRNNEKCYSCENSPNEDIKKKL
jgi:hypothetical protein